MHNCIRTYSIVLQLIRQAYVLTFPPTHTLCVTFIHKWRDLTFLNRFRMAGFRATSHSNFIYTQKFCQKSAEGKLAMKYISFC